MEDKITLVNHELNDRDTFHSFISCCCWFQAIRICLFINQMMSISFYIEKKFNHTNANIRHFRSSFHTPIYICVSAECEYNFEHDIIRSDLIFMLAMSQNCFYACTKHGHQKFSPSHIMSITKRFVIQKNCCNVTNLACH